MIKYVVLAILQNRAAQESFLNSFYLMASITVYEVLFPKQTVSNKT